MKFLVTGGVATLVAYVLLRLFYDVMHLPPVPAAFLSWAISLMVGFPLNRRFTFGVMGRDGRHKDFALYVVGAGLQLALGLAGYHLLLGRWHWNSTVAFVVNTAVTAAFSFAFLNLVTFRRVVWRQPESRS